MAKNDLNETTEILQLKLRIAEIQLLTEQEKTKQIQFEEETKRIQFEEETKRKQLEEETRRIQFEEETKRKQLEEETRRIQFEEETKRMKITHEQLSSSSSKNKDMSLLLSDLHFYNSIVDGNIHSFNTDWPLNDYNYFNNNITKHIQRYLDNVSKCEEINEELIQNNFNRLINNLLKTLNDSTSLKYLNTSNSHCLESNGRPDCTFILKNINIHSNKPCDSLNDFIICLGELKSPDIVITSKKAKGQILQYLQAILNTQDRQKIYGFLTNFTHITFFYVEKKSNSDGYHYFKSEDLEMFHDSFQPSATVEKKTTTRTTNRWSRKIVLNENTWKIFTKFLIMDLNFYQYTTLNINSLDDLFPNTYYIIKRLGHGLTSNVYLLEKNHNNHYNDDNLHYSVIKISRRTEYSSSFLNELKITQQLKQKNFENKFDLFFQDIIHSSPTGKFLIFKNKLEPIKSLSLIQSKQLIDILKYLYDCSIIHRDLRPHNLMLENSRQHLKLIDFGFAIRFDNQEKSQELSIAGTITYAGYEFLKFCSNLTLNSLFVQNYLYERTFDLKCALNIIMYMNYNEVRNTLNSIERLRFFHEKISASLILWKNIKQNNTNYSNFLNSINKITELSAFDALKDEIEKLLHS